jgi:hypothetical protein
MKSKIAIGIVLVILLIVAIAFSGCLEEKSKTIRIQSSVTKPTPTLSQVKNLGESKTIGCMQVTVLKYENFERKHQGPIPMEEGAKEIMIKVKAENVGEIRCTVPERSGIKLHYKGDVINPGGAPLMQSAPEQEEWYGSTYVGRIYPGVSKVGWIIFRVPKNVDMSQAYLVLNYHGTTTKWKLE